MTTKLNNAFKRELDIKGEKFTLTVSPEGFKLVQKGKRKGVQLNWIQLLNGEAALATALNASIAGHAAPLSAAPTSGGRYPTRH